MVCPTLQRPNLGLEQVQEYTVSTAVSPTKKDEADFNLGRDGYEDGTQIRHVTDQEALNGNSPGPRPHQSKFKHYALQEKEFLPGKRKTSQPCG